jgi:hypothetical protein
MAGYFSKERRFDTFQKAQRTPVQHMQKSAFQIAGTLIQLEDTILRYHSYTTAVQSSPKKRGTMTDLGAVLEQMKKERAQLDKAITALSPGGGNQFRDLTEQESWNKKAVRGCAQENCSSAAGTLGQSTG